MANALLPLFSGSLEEILKTIVEKTNDPIATELIAVNDLVNCYNSIYYAITEDFNEATLKNVIYSRITDEVTMLTIRAGEFEVSFLPKGKEPEYGPNHNWSRKNRQSGKPVRIFQKLLVKEFKTREWEIFNNLFKAELCQCFDFELVEGEDIRYWYNCEHYYRCDGTLGNSCMRYQEAQPYFDVYVDCAKMLITKKDGLLTGRALVWEMPDGIVLLDRIYTCMDYLENCFIDYAKEHGWWIRECNSLLSTGDRQYWLTPEEDYCRADSHEFTIHIPKIYEYFPYMDSFRYYDGDHTLSTHPIGSIALDSTDGSYREEEYQCSRCGRIIYGYSDETPDGMYWSEYDDCYYCGDCCWYSDGIDDYVGCDDASVTVINRWADSNEYPSSYVDDRLITDPDGTEGRNDIVIVDDKYYFVSNLLEFNEETKEYEIRSNSD